MRRRHKKLRHKQMYEDFANFCLTHDIQWDGTRKDRDHNMSGWE